MLLLFVFLATWTCVRSTIRWAQGRELCVSLLSSAPALVGNAVLTAQAIRYQSLSPPPRFCVQTASSLLFTSILHLLIQGTRRGHPFK